MLTIHCRHCAYSADGLLDYEHHMRDEHDPRPRQGRPDDRPAWVRRNVDARGPIVARKELVR